MSRPCLYFLCISFLVHRRQHGFFLSCSSLEHRSFPLFPHRSVSIICVFTNRCLFIFRVYYVLSWRVYLLCSVLSFSLLSLIMFVRSAYTYLFCSFSLRFRGWTMSKSPKRDEFQHPSSQPQQLQLTLRLYSLYWCRYTGFPMKSNWIILLNSFPDIETISKHLLSSDHPFLFCLAIPW